MTLFDPQIQNGYRQQTNKSVFHARELYYQNNICWKEIYKVDYVLR